MKRAIYWAACIAFYVGLVYLSQSSSAATCVFNSLQVLALVGYCIMLGDGKNHERCGAPGVVAFPIDVAVAFWSISIGGWMALGGILLFVNACLELVVFGDVKTKAINNLG